jgi:hypothetical protein
VRASRTILSDYNLKKEKLMDLNALMTQMKEMQAQITELIGKEESKQQQITPAPAISTVTLPKDHVHKLEKRINSLGCMLSPHEYTQLLEVIKKYKGMMGALLNGKASMSTFTRVLVLNFMENWQNMPMEALWKREIALSHYRARYSHIGRIQRKL